MSQLLKLFHIFHVVLLEFVEMPWVVLSTTRLNDVPSSTLSSLVHTRLVVADCDSRVMHSIILQKCSKAESMSQQSSLQ